MTDEGAEITEQLIEECTKHDDEACQLRNKKYIHFCNKKVKAGHTESNTYKLKNSGKGNYSEIKEGSEEDSEDSEDNYENYFN